MFTPNTTRALVSFGLLSAAFPLLAEDRIVVTASGYEQQEKNAPATISIVTAKELENKPYRDVTDALRDIPGVNVTGGAGSSDISIRGMDAKYTLILVDGKRVRTRETRPNSDAGGIEQGWLPPLSAIERIEVVRGPISSLYGSDAMGGVINIITRRIGKTWNSNVRLESTLQESRDSGNAFTTGFSTSGPIIEDTLGLQVYGQYARRSEDHFIAGFPEQKIRNINGKLSYQANTNHQFDLDLGIDEQDRFATFGKTASKKNSEHESRRTHEALTHYGKWDWGSSTTSLALDRTHNKSREMTINNRDLETQWLIPLNMHMVTLGGKYSYQRLNDRGNEISKTKTEIDRWDGALFLEDEWQVRDDLAITMGLRYNYDELFGSHWNPRLYAVWDINDNYTLKGGVSTGYTTPLLRYVTADWGQITGGNTSNGVIIGNPDLSPEKTTNIEIGLGYANDEGYNASLTTFYTRFTDKIQSYLICNDGNGLCSTAGVNGFDFVQSRMNVDKAELKGVEASLSMPLPYDFSLSTSYTWLLSKQKSGDYKGLPLNRTPKHKFNVQLDWAATQSLDLWGKAAYYGKEVELGKRDGPVSRYPGYTLWDLGATYRINPSAKLVMGVFNLFDKTIHDDEFGKTLDGRRYWLGIDIDF